MVCLIDKVQVRRGRREEIVKIGVFFFFLGINFMQLLYFMPHVPPFTTSTPEMAGSE